MSTWRGIFVKNCYFHQIFVGYVCVWVGMYNADLGWRKSTSNSNCVLKNILNTNWEDYHDICCLYANYWPVLCVCTFTWSGGVCCQFETWLTCGKEASIRLLTNLSPHHAPCVRAWQCPRVRRGWPHDTRLSVYVTSVWSETAPEPHAHVMMLTQSHQACHWAQTQSLASSDCYLFPLISLNLSPFLVLVPLLQVYHLLAEFNHSH